MAELKQGVEYYSEGDFYIYIEDVPSMPEFAVVREGGDDGYITVVRKNNLIPKEESWQWQQKQKYADELRLVAAKAEENLDKLKDRLVDKALQALSSRMKFNALFGKGGNVAWAGLVIEELEKLVKEKADDVIKGKDGKEVF